MENMWFSQSLPQLQSFTSIVPFTVTLSICFIRNNETFFYETILKMHLYLGGLANQKLVPGYLPSLNSVLENSRLHQPGWRQLLTNKHISFALLGKQCPVILEVVEESSSAQPLQCRLVQRPPFSIRRRIPQQPCSFLGWYAENATVTSQNRSVRRLGSDSVLEVNQAFTQDCSSHGEQVSYSIWA